MSSGRLWKTKWNLNWKKSRRRRRQQHFLARKPLWTDSKSKREEVFVQHKTQLHSVGVTPPHKGQNSQEELRTKRLTLVWNPDRKSQNFFQLKLHSGSMDNLFYKICLKKIKGHTVKCVHERERLPFCWTAALFIKHKSEKCRSPKVFYIKKNKVFKVIN